MSFHQSNKSGAFYLDNSSLQCKAGCGFFGNPEWDGYCSICFKQINNNRHHQQQQEQHHHHHQQHYIVDPTGLSRNVEQNSYPAANWNQQHNYHWLRQQQQQQYQHQSQAQLQQQLQIQQQKLSQHQVQQRPYSTALERDFYNMNLDSNDRDRFHLLSKSSGNQSNRMTGSTSYNQLSSDAQAGHLNMSQHQQSSYPITGPLIDFSDSPTVGPSSPFDKYGEKRRSQFIDKKSNVLKLLRRASTFKDKSHSISDYSSSKSHQADPESLQSPPLLPEQLQSSPPSIGNPSIDNQETNDSPNSNNYLQQQNQQGTSSSNSSLLNPGNLFSNLTSPTSFVMSGYDTLTNLHNTIMNTAKSSFRASPSLANSSADNSSIHSASQSEFMHNISGKKGSSQQARFLYDVAWVDCLRRTNIFAKEFLQIEKQPDKTINDLSDLVHEFYQKMSERFENQFIYKGASPDQLELLNDNMERILNEHIYQVISARIINEDEDHNMAIQKRIRSLNWITVEHLEIDIDFQHSVVHDLLDKAICQMVEMNSRTSSIDKLECIVQCSKTIFELLQESSSTNSNRSVPFSADQFLPVLVFVVIQANPPMLPADMKYLNRFSNPRRLMSGETGYYFTNLCCAVEFIEKASGTSLNITEDEFNRYVNGEAVPITKSQFSTYLSDGLRTMCSNDTLLKKLRIDYETRQTKLNDLSELIEVHLETNRTKLKEIETYSQNIKQKLAPTLPKFYLDLLAKDESSAIKLLPSKLRDIYMTQGN